MCFEKYMDDINYCVENFDINPENYKKYIPKELGIDADDSNEIYLKENLPDFLVLSIDKSVKNSRVFIGKNLIKKKKSFIYIKYDNQFVYLGSNVGLADLRVFMVGVNSFLIVGDRVEVIQHNSKWVTGTNAGNDCNGFIIGDDCLFGGENIIRAADGHPVMDLITNKQINNTKRPVIIEPYCWFGERVTILKNVRVGACSIVGFGAVVTKSCEKFSALSGIPATSKSIYGKLWKRNHSEDAQTIFNKYKKRFILDKED